MKTRLFTLLALLALLASACGGGAATSQDTSTPAADAGGDATPAEDAEEPSEGAEEPSEDAEEPAEGGETLASQYDLSGVEVRVGTKDFTEMLLLGEIARIVLEEAGATVEYTPDLPSPAGARDAMLAGEIDVTWEYTGTAWINYLGNDEPINDPLEQFEAVAEQDLEENEIYWSPPAAFDDTYGIAYRSEAAEDFGITTLSDLATFVTENPDQATLCLDNSFGARNDGLPGLEETYGFTWPQDQLFVSEFGVIYTSTDQGNPCNFGEIFTTDGRIAALDLTVIEDDQNFFLSYLSSLTMPAAFNEENPEIGELFAEVGEPLTEEEMTALNARVDVDGEFEEDVARQWLVDQGFIAG